MSILEALIRKGSTGGNNIEEAIENLPDISSGGGGTTPVTPTSAGLPTVAASDVGKALVVKNNGEWGVSYNTVTEDPVVWEFNGTGSEFVDAFEWTLFDYPYGSGTMPVLLAPIDTSHALFNTNNLIEYLYDDDGTPRSEITIMGEVSGISGAYSSLTAGPSFYLGDLPGGFISGDFSSIGGYSSVTAIMIFGQWSGTLEDDLATLQTVASNVENIHIVVKDVGKSRQIIPVVISKTFDSNDMTASVNLSYDELYAIYVDNNQAQFYTKLPIFFDNGKPVTGYLQYNGSDRYVEIVTNDLAVESDSVYVNEMKYRVNYNDKVWIAGNTSYPVTTGTATTGYTEQSPK